MLEELAKAMFFLSTIRKPRRKALCSPYQSSIVNGTFVLLERARYGNAT